MVSIVMGEQLRRSTRAAMRIADAKDRRTEFDAGYHVALRSDSVASDEEMLASKNHREK